MSCDDLRPLATSRMKLASGDGSFQGCGDRVVLWWFCGSGLLYWWWCIAAAAENRVAHGADDVDCFLVSAGLCW
ncbi:hypothetical protein QVD17_07046 [Tagetes erecta]|uniref:Uncharacterized protein n=1 Tax=Tagetes erecta TaxID=13708 RepID=A0AAD8LPM1_TARER|nr:hypothetical protein QVD17_07046 [Tagetes erecta]